MGGKQQVRIDWTTGAVACIISYKEEKGGFSKTGQLISSGLGIKVRKEEDLIGNVEVEVLERGGHSQ